MGILWFVTALWTVVLIWLFFGKQMTTSQAVFVKGTIVLLVSIAILTVLGLVYLKPDPPEGVSQWIYDPAIESDIRNAGLNDPHTSESMREEIRRWNNELADDYVRRTKKK